MSKKERKIYEFEMDSKKCFCCCSNLCNDDIIYQRPGLRIGIHLEARSENGCEK